MHHLIVTRVGIGLTLLFMTAAAAFAWVASARPSTHDTMASDGGAALFDRHCVSCHAVEDVVAMVRATPEERERRTTEVLAFLSQHGDSTDEEDRILLEYLQSH